MGHLERTATNKKETNNDGARSVPGGKKGLCREIFSLQGPRPLQGNIFFSAKDIPFVENVFFSAKGAKIGGDVFFRNFFPIG